MEVSGRFSEVSRQSVIDGPHGNSYIIGNMPKPKVMHTFLFTEHTVFIIGTLPTGCLISKWVK